MFEKEAEEYVRKIRQDVINWDGAEPEERFYNEIKFKQAYQQGAAFGYNKSKEELNQNGLALQSDMDKTIEQNIALKKELNKANEWHYMKDVNCDEDFLVVQENPKLMCQKCYKK